ncbi:hypothetical protein, partial [Bradyrhizobium cosmicum]|uniref:hypothetical protein n=1 Tax=Bradyrhizobium cosmicum TaxID=1404864 RepID=UPI0028EBE708
IYPPSLALRRDVSNRAFYLNGLIGRLDRPLLDNDNYSEFLRVYKTTRGWMPEGDVRGGVFASECEIAESEFFDVQRLAWKTYTEDVLD